MQFKALVTCIKFSSQDSYSGLLTLKFQEASGQAFWRGWVCTCSWRMSRSKDKIQRRTFQTQGRKLGLCLVIWFVEQDETEENEDMRWKKPRMWRDRVVFREEVANSKFKGRPKDILCLALTVLTHTGHLVWFGFNFNLQAMNSTILSSLEKAKYPATLDPHSQEAGISWNYVQLPPLDGASAFLWAWSVPS